MDDLDLSTESLPRTHVLSYVSSISSPTRVRIVAARVTRLAGFLNAALGVLLAASIGWDTYRRAEMLAGAWIGPPGPIFPPHPVVRGMSVSVVLEALAFTVRHEPFMVFCLVVAASSAVFLWLMAAPIKRGASAASRATQAYFGAWIIPAFLATVSLGVYAFARAGIVVHEQHPNRWALWWLFMLPVGSVAILILRDICVLLVWITRNPGAEKPRVPFLPQKAA